MDSVHNKNPPNIIGLTPLDLTKRSGKDPVVQLITDALRNQRTFVKEGHR